jgi:glyoxylase-like metal-dependent hydrolase (beta-lactamase superfamily II)
VSDQEHGCGEGPAGEPPLFEIKPVADGVWAAVAARAYKVNCNTAVIDTGDGLMVVDSHSKPSAARALLGQLRDVTRQPVRYLVNTHFHWDHWQGNEAYQAAFPGVEVVTNDVTREAMLRRGLKRIQDHVRAGPGEVEALRAQLAAARGPEERAQLRSSLAQAEAYLAEVRALRPTLPTLTFERTMRLFRRDREVHLLHLGRAHTDGDVFVHLPREAVVVTGDAVNGWTPYMGDGYPEEWPATLDRLAALGFDRMILGHGDVVGREWLAFFRGYVHDLVETVRREAATGASLDEVKARVVAALGPRYETGLDRAGGTYRPWRTLVLANVERAFAHVS